MKTTRLVSLFVVPVLAALLVMAAQSNPVAYAGAADIAANDRVLAAASIRPGAESPAAKFAKASSYFSIAPIFVAIGDLNGDGHPDVVAINGGVDVLLGNGDGTFQDKVSYSSGVCGYASVAIGDVNGDGKPDLVVAGMSVDQCSGPADGEASVLLGNGDGTFQAPIIYKSGGINTGARITSSVALADLNGDGHLDVVVANDASNSVGVLLNNGDGTFQSGVTYSCGQYSASSVAITDLNGDGHPDLVVAGGGVSVLLGNGDGTFHPAVGYSEANAVAVATGDLDGDGHPDVVVGKEAATEQAADAVDVLLGNGDGTLRAAVGYPVALGISWSVAIVDLNGDGHLDLAVADGPGNLRNFAGEVSWLLGNGDGTFRAAQHSKTGGQLSYSIAVGDLNGDGRPDLVLPNADSNSVGVLLNITTAKTKTAITSSLNPSQVSQPVTFTATITPNGLSVPDGEIVTFYNGNVSLGTAPTINGSASLTTSFSRAKSYSIKAKYSGGGFLKASSGIVKQVVNP